ncbi:unnamed protein product [Peronospora belbahrii]|uniref:Uncharacterized protein n=1 Tax=Peronospora belbahrii TaxID=622444 RepID=A0AAU9KT67_9STRA|nr:unnamed protein product [Peronospora belbahrii]
MLFKEGLKLFEVSDVVVLDDNTNVCAKNLMGYPSELKMPAGTKEYYTVTPAEERTYFPGRCAYVILQKEDARPLCLGTFGVLVY